MACCKIRLQSLENISKWSYQDDQCVMQGPYDSLLMLKWIYQGYFDESTVILEEKFSTKMSLKRALISLKEDAIKHAQAILGCPHYSNDVYSFATYDHYNPIQNMESISTCIPSARSETKTREKSIIYRNVADFDKKASEDYSIPIKKPENKDVATSIDISFFPYNITNNKAELSPSSDKSIVTSSSYYSTRPYELQGLEDALNHLKRIEKHKISGFLERIMCMGSDIQYNNSCSEI